MGSAIARALIAGGYSVTAWNRSLDKIEALNPIGVLAAATLSTAIAASPIVIICVRNYSTTQSLIESPEIRAAISGRLVVQLTTGSPTEARALAEYVRAAGGDYLDGAMLVYPELIGTPSARFFVAGARQSFDRFEPLLRCIAPDSVYAGPNVGAGCAQESALMALVLGAFLGFIHGVRVCEAEGLDRLEYAERMTEACMHLGPEMRALVRRMTEEQFDDTHAPLHTYQSAARILLEHAQVSNLDVSFPACANETLRRGLEAGFGQSDLAALIKVLPSEPDEAH